MTELPNGWAGIKIVEVLEPNENEKPFQQGWSPQCEKVSASEDDWAVLKTTAIQEGEFLAFENKILPVTLEPRPHLEVKAGDILMTCAGPRNRCGVTCLVKKTRSKLMMSGKMYRFRPNTRIINSKYLELYLHSHDTKQAIDQMKTGISDSGLNLTHGRLSELYVPLPPINEQHNIVDKIEELFSDLDKGIESLKTAREQLKVYRQAILKHTFEGKLTELWREANKHELETPEQLLTWNRTERDRRYQHQVKKWNAAVETWKAEGKKGKKPSRPKQPNNLAAISSDESKSLPELPMGWVYTRLGDLIDEPKYGTSKKCDYGINGIGVLRIPNVAHGVIDASDLKFAQFEDDEVKTYNLKEGDILTVRSNGSISLVGKCALISELEVNYVYAGYLIRLRPNQDLIVPEFLISILSSHSIRVQIEQKAKSTSGVNNINSSEIQHLIFPICSIAEQQESIQHLSTILSSTDMTETEIDQQIVRSVSLRQSILKRAFSGQLVEQDPNDEPASILLERVRVEKAERRKSNGKKNKKKTEKDTA